MDDLINNPKKTRKSLEPVRYIHIGYPKAASTVLQKGYLGRHNQLLHLGCGRPEARDFFDDHGYIDNGVNIAMEVDLRYRTSLSYDPVKTRAAFDKYFQKASEDRSVHAVGVSNENFCFNWHGGIDVAQKAERLCGVFGRDTRILIVIRNQKSLIESLYKESIRFGYGATFEDFLKYLWTYKDRNFLYEFCFEKILGLYSDHFGHSNVHCLFFEQLKRDSRRFFVSVSEAIGIDYYGFDVSKEYNRQLDPKELSIKRSLNRSYLHTLGKGKFDVIDSHRFTPYYTDVLDDRIDNEVFLDYYVRGELNRLAGRLKGLVTTEDLRLDWNSTYGQNILNLFRESNTILAASYPELNEALNTYGYLTIE